MLRHFARGVHGEPESLRQVIASLEGDAHDEKKPRLSSVAGAYVSDFEQFLNGYLAEHPEVEADRRRGWYIWWDHRVDPDLLDKQRADAVPDKPYHSE